MSEAGRAIPGPDGRLRCDWGSAWADPLYVAYHDEEWGVPLRDERALLELLCLEGAQAGLSWSTILHKREGYRRAFASFDPETVAAFGPDDSVKSRSTGGVNPWPADRYLNMWVCRLGGGLLGYAQFPGGPSETDGVVIRNTAFGTTGTVEPPFNIGRTGTHEVGHFLNLYHIWGLYDDCTGGDMVSDTPNAAGPNYGEPNFPHVSCNNGPNGDMYMNYMDYVDDRVMCMFTAQQVARMMATLDGPRSALGRS
jgi:hypothetical protein